MFGIGGNLETVIGEGAELLGSLTVPGALYVNGHVHGDVTSRTLITLGEKSDVEGNIAAPILIIGGRLRGHAEAEVKVELLGTARVEGDIHSPKLSMAEGAIFEGTCDMPSPDHSIVDFNVVKKK